MHCANRTHFGCPFPSDLAEATRRYSKTLKMRGLVLVSLQKQAQLLLLCPHGTKCFYLILTEQKKTNAVRISTSTAENDPAFGLSSLIVS
jgi:hypothetical protein